MGSSFRKPHFLPVQKSVILIRDLMAGYVILCGTSRQWRLVCNLLQLLSGSPYTLPYIGSGRDVILTS
jgi:hypothetical protein